jgi:hypothetical protein
MKQNIRLLQQELQRFPFVEASATSMSIPIGYSGNPVTDDNGNVLFSTRFEIADDNYIPTMEMTFVKGGNFTGSKQVIVTEEFVKKTGWKDNLVEKEVKSGAEETYGTVVGILKNYASEPLLMGNGYEPVLIVRQEYVSTYLMLRLTKITSENLEAINDKLSDNENPFSGGQQQRVAIARAVVANPKLIWPTNLPVILIPKTASK